MADQEKLNEFVKNRLVDNKDVEILCFSSSVSVVKLNLAVFSYLFGVKQANGIVLCVDRPSAHYKKLLDLHHLPSANLYALEVGLPNASSDTNIHSPTDLTEMKIRLMDLARKIKKGSKGAFFLIDCIPTLAAYNDFNVLVQFFHELLRSMRGLGVFTIILLDSDARFAPIKRLCDEDVKIEEDRL